MAPLYTLLLMLPAALVLIGCTCRLVVLRPPVPRPVGHPMVGRGGGGRRAA
jgi:hypothetical protein